MATQAKGTTQWPLDHEGAARQRYAERRELIRGLRALGPLQILMDGRDPGAEGLPERLRSNMTVALTVTTTMPLDLDSDPDVLRARMSFDGEVREVTLPWGAIYAVRPDDDEPACAWAWDVPPELGGHPAPWRPVRETFLDFIGRTVAEVSAERAAAGEADTSHFPFDPPVTP